MGGGWKAKTSNVLRQKRGRYSGIQENDSGQPKNTTFDMLYLGAKRVQQHHSGGDPTKRVGDPYQIPLG